MLIPSNNYPILITPNFQSPSILVTQPAERWERKFKIGKVHIQVWSDLLTIHTIWISSKKLNTDMRWEISILIIPNFQSTLILVTQPAERWARKFKIGKVHMQAWSDLRTYFTQLSSKNLNSDTDRWEILSCGCVCWKENSQP